MSALKRLMVCICCIMVLLAGCGTQQPGTTQEPEEETTDVLAKDKTYSVLFIGNSYTFYNDMPTGYFETMAKACGYDVKVTSITKGAYTLEKFADPNDVYGKMVDNALKNPGTYDFVILQEQSMRPALDTVDKFYEGVRKLTEKIRAAGAEPFLYATWGRESGNSKLDEYSMTNESMTWKLAAAYAAIGEELEIPVAHVGLAFCDVYSSSQIDLYSADGSHPSATGSYLAAMTLFGSIFGVDPVGAPFKGPASSEEDGILRAAAKAVLDEKPVIPEEYKTDSRQAN